MAKIRITESELKQVIRESVEKVLNEEENIIQEGNWFNDVWNARTNARNLDKTTNILNTTKQDLAKANKDLADKNQLIDGYTKILNGVLKSLNINADENGGGYDLINNELTNVMKSYEDLSGIMEKLYSTVKPQTKDPEELIKKIGQWGRAAKQWYAYQKSQKNATQQQATPQHSSQNTWATKTMERVQNQMPKITTQPTAPAKTVGATTRTTDTSAGTNRAVTGKTVNFNSPLDVINTNQRR